MKALASIIATMLVLLLASVAIALAKSVFFAVTGRNTPLRSKVQDQDDPDRGLLAESEDAGELTRGSFSNTLRELCPLHEKPYLGYTRFRLSRPGGIGAQTDRTVGFLAVVGCVDCADAAYANRERRWTRAGYKEHPDWASTQLYPHLLKDTEAAIAGAGFKTGVFLAFQDHAAVALARDWMASPDAQRRADGVRALLFRKDSVDAEDIRTLLNDTAVVGKVRFLGGGYEVVNLAASEVLKQWGAASTHAVA